MCFAVFIQPAFNDLHTLQLRRVRVGHGPGEKRGLALAVCMQGVTHGRTVLVGILNEGRAV